MSVLFTATDGRAAACIDDAVVSAGGQVTQLLGMEGQILAVTMSVAGIKAVASRADVQGVDSAFDGTPPP